MSRVQSSAPHRRRSWQQVHGLVISSRTRTRRGRVGLPSEEHSVCIVYLQHDGKPEVWQHAADSRRKPPASPLALHEDIFCLQRPEKLGDQGKLTCALIVISVGVLRE